MRRVEDRPFIPDALADLGIRPDVEYSQRSSLLTAHRVGEGVDYYYLCNGFHSEGSSVQTVDHTVSLRRNHPGAVPYALDAWTGRIERIVLYEESKDSIGVRVTLKPGEATIIAIGRRDWYNDREERGLHATRSDADEVRFRDGDLLARASQTGTYATTLSNGRTVTTAIDNVAPAQTLSTWHLAIDDWRPGDSPIETVVLYHELTLDGLKAWTEIPELLDVSGIGRHSTTVELGDGWTGGHGAYLDLGEVLDTFQVIVNGRELPAVDQVNPVVDIGPYLESGTNTIEVEVATTLNNPLRVSNSQVFGMTPRQRYGLIGPVKLIPYGQAAISPARGKRV